VFLLRAERAGTGDGRVYTITYRAIDAAGNSAEASCVVTVPHDVGAHASNGPESGPQGQNKTNNGKKK